MDGMIFEMKKVRENIARKTYENPFVPPLQDTHFVRQISGKMHLLGAKNPLKPPKISKVASLFAAKIGKWLQKVKPKRENGFKMCSHIFDRVASLFGFIFGKWLQNVKPK